MTTRYCGRIDKLASNRGSNRSREVSDDMPDDLIDRPLDGAPACKPTPAETLERLLDTHNWLRVRKSGN